MPMGTRYGRFGTSQAQGIDVGQGMVTQGSQRTGGARGVTEAAVKAT